MYLLSKMAEPTTATEGTPGLEPTEEAPPEQKVTRSKDPKKVAAGCAGEDARKWKQQKLLDDLRHLKSAGAERPANDRKPATTSDEHNPQPP